MTIIYKEKHPISHTLCLISLFFLYTAIVYRSVLTVNQSSPGFLSRKNSKLFFAKHTFKPPQSIQHITYYKLS